MAGHGRRSATRHAWTGDRLGWCLGVLVVVALPPRTGKKPPRHKVTKVEGCNLREVRRLTKLLLKIKRYERQMEANNRGSPLCIRNKRRLVFCVKMSKHLISFKYREFA